MNALDHPDAIMAGTANYMDWRRRFLASWEEGLMRGNIQRAWAMMPPMLKEQLKQADPQGFKRVLEFLSKGD